MYTSPIKKEGATNGPKDASGDLNESLHNAANNAGRTVRGMYNTASDEITHASEKLTSEIRSNPVRSSMVALGVGVLLGALIRR